MESAIILGVSGLFLTAVLFLARKRQANGKIPRNENLASLEEVLKSAEATNNGFFHSLELVQKNLESLLVRAESAEQRLRNLMLQPGVEKKEQYAAAALLLDNGQDAERVASMLNLPVPQVQIVQELQKFSHKERRFPARRKRDQEPAGESPQATKIAAQRENISARPILLVDVIRNAAEEAAQYGNGHGRLNGTVA